MSNKLERLAAPQAINADALECSSQCCSLSTSNQITARTRGNWTSSFVSALVIHSALPPPLSVEPTSGNIIGLLVSDVSALYGSASAWLKLRQYGVPQSRSGPVL